MSVIPFFDVGSIAINDGGGSGGGGGGGGLEGQVDLLAVATEVVGEATAEGGEESTQVETLVGEDAGGDDVVGLVVLCGVHPRRIGPGAQNVCGQDKGDLEHGERPEQWLSGEVSGFGQGDSHRFFAVAALGR